MPEALQVSTKQRVSLRQKLAVAMAVVGVISGLAASVVATTTGGDQESARTFIWILLAGSGLAPVALFVGRVG